MKIEKSIIINKSSRLVFDYLKMTRNQDNFSVWNMADPKMKKSYKGTDGKVGFKYSWDSILKNVGAGEQEIAAIDDGKSIDYTIRFSRPMQNTGKTRFQITSLGIDNTSVPGHLIVLPGFQCHYSRPYLRECWEKILQQASKT